MAQMSSRGTQLFCSLFIVIGLVAVGMGVWILTKSLRAENWPVTDGLIPSAATKQTCCEYSFELLSNQVA